MPAKVLYVSHASGYHGAVMSLCTLVRGLDRERFTPYAAFSKDGLVVGDLVTEGVDARVLKKRGFLNSGLIKEAYGFIRSEGIDLVHLNNAVAFCRDVGIAARLAGVPVIWHVREDPAGKRLRRLAPLVRLIAARVLVVSGELEDFFRGSGKAVKVYNGVDTVLFSPDVDGTGFRKRAGFGPGDMVFGIIGTIEPRKGTMSFFGAAERIAASEPTARFLAAGSGLPEYEAALARFLGERPRLKERTYLAGRVREVPEAMAACDVIVMPSTWEGFPRVVIEAMASARPVIATAVGEVSEMVEDGVTGFIIPPGDDGALEGAMRGCIGGRDRLDRMGEAARQKAAGSFTTAAHAGKVQAVYDAVLGARAGRGREENDGAA